MKKLESFVGVHSRAHTHVYSFIEIEKNIYKLNSRKKPVIDTG